MNRQPIDGGGWINLETAQKFVEDRNWDGHNMISAATGSQWEHETLYRQPIKDRSSKRRTGGMRAACIDAPWMLQTDPSSGRWPTGTNRITCRPIGRR